MTMRLSMAAGRTSFVILWAVFFSQSVFGAETSLFRLESGLNELVYQLSRSVVTVESSISVNSPQLPGQSNETMQSLISSGIIYDLLGHILVAAPAVTGRDQILVRFEEEVIPARVRGIDYQTGLAVIHINRRIGIPATFSDREGCAGQMVIAMGNCYGVRACPLLGFCAGFRPDGTVQFSSAITPGTVGGGVFDLNGNLVGLIIGGIGSRERPQAGLAVPACRISEIVPHLLMQGDRQVGYAGLSTADIHISPPIRLTQPNLLASTNNEGGSVISQGVMITGVVPSSPAARSGLREKDLLLSMDGIPLRSALDLRNRVRQAYPGTVIELQVLRNETPFGVRLKIGSQPVDSMPDRVASLLSDETELLSDDSLRRELESLQRALRRLELQLQLRQRR
ncbi:MAG: S1C family serine protease [bacterium]